MDDPVFRYDEELQMEAHFFKGLKPAFPPHFHEHYLFGLVEEGARTLFYKGCTYTAKTGALLAINPGDPHACEQLGPMVTGWRALNVPTAVLQALAQELTGSGEAPLFAPPVIWDPELAAEFGRLHQLILEGSGEFEKEELLLFFFDRLLGRYSRPISLAQPESRAEVERACDFIREHYTEHIALDDLCAAAALSRSSLLRAFTRAKGVTPYRYLQSVRVERAKVLLEQGAAPAEAALAAGFADQSHFHRFFSLFIGMPPGAYREIFFQK